MVRWLALVAALPLAVGCENGSSSPAAPTQVVRLRVVDEAGASVPGATLTLTGTGTPIPLASSEELQVDQPVAGVVRADGFLDEPIAVDPDDGELTVRLLARVGPGGTERTVFHFGGDVMLGRRYQNPPEGSDTAVVTDEREARDAVASLAPLMAAADATVVNLESVLGDLPMSEAAPGKRYLIQSPAATVAALDSLGVDAVTLGNNHSNDWQEEGLESTLHLLEVTGTVAVGAGVTEEEAQRGVLLDAGALRVGMVSATTVNGDFVNDSLPLAGDPRPGDLDPDDEWQYEERPFRFHDTDGEVDIPAANVLPGDAWAEFRDVEDDLSPGVVAAYWAELTDVFPELQDWVARRGHGGAAMFRRGWVGDEITRLRAEGADLVIVQIHGGFQFSDVPSAFLRDAAHDSIDLGADLVVGHHPHVLQGFETYQGKLIAYSLGNLLFDQDFLATFPSVMLRTVFEGDELVEARVVPVVLARYRPVPATGEAADRIVQRLTASSMTTAVSVRLAPDLIGSVVADGVATDTSVVRDGASALVVRGRAEVPLQLDLEPGVPADLTACSVVRPESGPADLELGFDVLAWGSLDDSLADGLNSGAAFWDLRDAAARFDAGHRGLVYLEAFPGDAATTRQIARSPVPAHRWYLEDGSPADGPARYTLRMEVRRRGEMPSAEIALYDVDDMDPTVDPTSVLLHEADVTLPRVDDDEWVVVEVDVTDIIATEYRGVRAEALLLYLKAQSGDNRVEFDDVRLYEWRGAAELPAGAWTAAHAVRSTTGGTADLAVHGCAG